MNDKVDTPEAKLKEWGCCMRCVYRLLGEANHEKYVEAESSSAVCIACLGILQERFCTAAFAKEIHRKVNESNHEYETFNVALSFPANLLVRERALKLAISKTFPDNPPISVIEQMSVKEVWRLINLSRLEKELGRNNDGKSLFTITLNFCHQATDSDCSFLTTVFPDTFRKRKCNSGTNWELFNRSNVSKALDNPKLSDDKFMQVYKCPPKPLKEPCDCDPIACRYESIFIAGRYNKYSRNLSQTEWLIDGQKKTETSVEELIAEPVQKLFVADERKFSSSGREDVDVRMLGNGRPFVIELLNSKHAFVTQKELTDLEVKINASSQDIFVRYLQKVKKEDTAILKTGETEKLKSYSALCWCDKQLTQDDAEKIVSVKDLVLQQKTPIRVLHRRPASVREKTVHEMNVELINDHHFKLCLKTQAGTYIKEFVHGDLGRTSPSLSSLLNANCDILQLDVEEVLLDWPNPINTSETGSNN